jgi:hypothetical protein
VLRTCPFARVPPANIEYSTDKNHLACLRNLVTQFNLVRFPKRNTKLGDGIHVFTAVNSLALRTRLQNFCCEVKSASAPLYFPFFRHNRIFAAE